MTNAIEIRSHANESESRTTLDALFLEGARAMLHRALEVEVEAYLERHQAERDENGRALVTRHGKARPRQVTIGAGTMTVEAPRVRDRRVDPAGHRQRFTSAILPPYMRRSPKVGEVLLVNVKEDRHSPCARNYRFSPAPSTSTSHEQWMLEKYDHRSPAQVRRA